MRRLPNVYRLPVILCCLEGRSQEEAARQLGWSAGSVKGRLERGRARLHDRLVRRGLTLSAVLAAAEVPHCAAPAAVVAQLATAIRKCAPALWPQPMGAAPEFSAQAAVLAREMLRGMALLKLKIAATFVLAACLATVSFLIHRNAGAASTMAQQLGSSPQASEQRAAASDAVARVQNQAQENRATRRTSRSQSPAVCSTQQANR